MEILQFLLRNWDSVALVIAILFIIIYLIKTGQTKILKKIAIQFVTEAEKELGDGTGIFKQAAVIEWLYNSMPTIVKVLFTKKDLEKLVDAVVEEVKLKWAENNSIQEYISGNKTDYS